MSNYFKDAGFSIGCRAEDFEKERTIR